MQFVHDCSPSVTCSGGDPFGTLRTLRVAPGNPGGIVPSAAVPWNGGATQACPYPNMEKSGTAPPGTATWYSEARRELVLPARFCSRCRG